VYRPSTATSKGDADALVGVEGVTVHAIEATVKATAAPKAL
jgi:hypothetical protein